MRPWSSSGDNPKHTLHSGQSREKWCRWGQNRSAVNPESQSARMMGIRLLQKRKKNKNKFKRLNKSPSQRTGGFWCCSRLRGGDEKDPKQGKWESQATGGSQFVTIFDDSMFRCFDVRGRDGKDYGICRSIWISTATKYHGKLITLERQIRSWIVCLIVCVQVRVRDDKGNST